MRWIHRAGESRAKRQREADDEVLRAAQFKRTELEQLTEMKG